MRRLFLRFSIFIFICLSASSIFYFVQAAKPNVELKIYNSNLEFKKSFSLPDWSVDYSLSLIDLGGDGQKEILWSAGLGQEPMIKIFRSDGSIIGSFLAYDKNFKGGVSALGCRLNNDNQEEIVTVPISSGGAHIRIFSSYGQPVINNGFFAFDQNNKNGLRLACVDVNGDKIDEFLVLGEEKNQRQLRLFDVNGKKMAEKNINFQTKKVNISAIDLGGDGLEEILIIGASESDKKVGLYRGDLSLIGEFNLGSQFSAGAEGLGFDFDHDGKGEIVLTSGVGLEPTIYVYDSYGNLKSEPQKISDSQNMQGGFYLLLGDVFGDGKIDYLVAPKRLLLGRTDLYKYIDVDVSEQRFRYYQNGYLIDDVLTSTGKPSTPTRLGEFTAFSKYEMAYGGADGQKWAMPYFIGFYKSGGLENGIHELPFLDGRREGERSLGQAVSHGCVRLGIGQAKLVYDWLEIDKTKVIVHK